MSSLSPILFSIFHAQIISDALEEHDGKVSIGDRTIPSHILISVHLRAMDLEVELEKKKTGR